MAATSTRQRPITPDDLAAKLRELEGGARDLAALLLLLTFLLGRRAGKQRSTIVEIRRV
jgi:hypothetical protein